jgi:hypothetical protein
MNTCSAVKYRQMEMATYRITSEKNGNGTYFFTDCGHWMFSIKDRMAYHGCLCPGYLYIGKSITLYIRGSKEVNEYISEAGVPKFQRHFT